MEKAISATALHQAVASLNQEAPIADLIGHLLDETARRTRAGRAFLCGFLQEEGQLLIWGTDGQERLQREETCPAPEVLERVRQEGTIQVGPLTAPAEGLRGVLAAPITLAGTVYGALLLLFPGGDEPSVQVHAEVSRQVAHLRTILSLAVTMRQMQRQLEESQALLRISRSLAQAAPMEDLLAGIAQTAVESIPAAEDGVIHLLGEDGESLEPMGVFRGTVPREQRIYMRLGVGAAGVALQEGRTIRINDVGKDPLFVPGETPPPYRSLLVAPMEIGGRKLGTLSIKSGRPAAFSQEDERFLTILAGQAAMVVENDRLLGELRRRLDDLRQMQSHLIRSEKLVAIGRLAASVAHEINNPLEGIKNYLVLLERRLPPNGNGRRLLDQVRVGFERIQNTVRQLLSFSREEEVARHPCDLNEAVENALAMTRRTLASHNVRLHLETAPSLPQMIASPPQVEQVLVNLLLNAAEAMGPQGGGDLYLRTWADDEGMVWVSLRDTGPGLPEEVRERIFEPFVSTRQGKAGLGLWVSYGVVSEHGGRIGVESVPGQGTTFTIGLPVREESP